MKKKAYIMMAAMVIALSAAACSAKPDSKAASTAQTEQATQAAASGEDAADGTAAAGMGNDSSAGANDASSGSITGIVEENKGFMITIDTDKSQKDSQAYVFSLNDKQSETYRTIKAGDKVTVSYTGGIPTPDNLDTVVTDIQVVK